MPPIWIIINPKAGNKKTRLQLKEAVAIIKRKIKNIDLYYTENPGDAFNIARLAVFSGIKKIVICGGDGTIHEILPALRNTDTVMAILPVGSCNDFARYLEIPRSIKLAVECSLNGRVKEVDLGKCGDNLFASVAAVGFDAEVNLTVERKKKRKSMRTYLFEGLKLLRNYRSNKMSLQGDFGLINVNAILVACANTGSYGGGLRITPQASPNDGLFDICIISPLSFFESIKLLLNILRGNHVNHPSVRIEKSSFLAIESDSKIPYCLDGEPRGILPIRLDIITKAIKVTVPK